MKKVLSLLTLLLAVCSGAWGADYTWTFDAYCTNNSIESGGNANIDRSKTTVVSTSATVDLSYVTDDNSESKIYNLSTAATVGGIEYNSYLYMGGAGSKYPSSGNLRYFTTGTITGSGKLTIVYAGTASGTCYIYEGNTASTTDDALTTLTPSASSSVTSSVIDCGAGKSLSICHDAKCYIYAIKWTEVPAAEVPTVSTSGAVNGNSDVTISSNYASTIYYYWSDSNIAPDAGDPSYSSASGASVTVKTPNVTGTRYLHAYGYNVVGTSSIETFTYSLTKTQLPAGLSFAKTTLSKYLGAANFNNTLTNPYSLSVTYSITNNGTGSSINTTTGEVTVGSTAGSETITVSSDETSDYLAGEATYTLTIEQDLRGTTLYSWDVGTQTGGTITCPNASANVGETYITNAGSNATYTGASSKFLKLVLDKTLKAGDQIKVTGYRNKDGDSKTSGFACTFSKDGGTTLVSSSNMIACSTGYEFPNINASAGTDSNKGNTASTVTFTVPSAADGSNAILITRSHTTTNTYFTKIEIYRPTINISVTLNAVGLLTSDEISSTAAFNFGINSANERVDAGSDDAVATISGNYHNDHGCTGVSVTTAVTKPVKITIGQCTFSKSQVTIKNSSNEDIALLNPNNPACWKNSKSNVDVFYYTGVATTLTISGMSYCPYVAIEEVEPSDAVINITPAYEKTTYVSTLPLDFSEVDGLKAYRASSAAGGSVTLAEVSTVPPATPLVLIGTASTKYTIPVSSSLASAGTNLLVAGDGTTEFDGTTYDYILFSDGLFYQIGEGKVATNKAYLHCDSDPTATGGARGLTLDFGEGETTGIKAIENAKTSNGIYNLNGQRVSQPTRGLYIVNGKKVIIK